MKIYTVAILLSVFTACATPMTIMYSASVDTAQGEQAWSRAHSYIVHNGLYVKSTPYCIWGRSFPHNPKWFIVSKEQDQNKTIIKISSEIYITDDTEGINSDIMQNAISKKYFLNDILTYMKTGVSPSMVDRDIPAEALKIRPTAKQRKHEE